MGVEIVTQEDLRECMKAFADTLTNALATLQGQTTVATLAYLTRKEAAQYLRLGRTKLDQLVAP